MLFSEHEPPEMRIAAFRALLNAVPNIPETSLEMIVDHLHRETSEQVKSFVYSYLSGLGTSPLPSEDNMYIYHIFNVFLNINISRNISTRKFFKFCYHSSK